MKKNRKYHNDKENVNGWGFCQPNSYGYPYQNFYPQPQIIMVPPMYPQQQQTTVSQGDPIMKQQISYYRKVMQRRDE
jgi:alkylated DNA repair dioxygenase AlkB